MQVDLNVERSPCVSCLRSCSCVATSSQSNSNSNSTSSSSSSSSSSTSPASTKLNHLDDPEGMLKLDYFERHASDVDDKLRRHVQAFSVKQVRSIHQHMRQAEALLFAENVFVLEHGCTLGEFAVCNLLQDDT